MSAAPLLLHVFPTFRVGGSQARFVTIANHFAGRYRHAIVALDAAYDCLIRFAPNTDAQCWDVPAPKGNTIGNVRAFRRILCARGPDLLITYNWGAIEWALANWPRLVPHIHVEDGFGRDEARRQLLRRVLTRRLTLAQSTVVLPSRTLYRLALERWHLRSDRIHHIPNGIELNRFVRPCTPISLPPGSGPVIGTVAAMRPEKNIGRLLTAFRNVRETQKCRLVIAGDGAERAALEELAARLLPADSFRFLGHIEDVERVYAALDIFVLSSDTEQMPTSIMEAMAAGLPVISTDVGDVRDMVSAENRRFIDDQGGEKFADLIRQLVSDAAMRTDMGQANRVIASAKFGIARMLAEYDGLFSSAIRGAPAGIRTRERASG